MKICLETLIDSLTLHFLLKLSGNMKYIQYFFFKNLILSKTWTHFFFFSPVYHGQCSVPSNFNYFFSFFESTLAIFMDVTTTSSVRDGKRMALKKKKEYGWDFKIFGIKEDTTKISKLIEVFSTSKINKRFGWKTFPSLLLYCQEEVFKRNQGRRLSIIWSEWKFSLTGYERVFTSERTEEKPYKMIFIDFPQIVMI